MTGDVQRPPRPSREEPRTVGYRVWQGRWGWWHWQVTTVGVGLLSEGGCSLLPRRSKASAERRVRRVAAKIARAHWPDGEATGEVGV